MSNSNAKGDRRERELVNRFDEAGYAVMRAPASGSATERELPDVLAGDGDRFYAVEAKSSAGDPIYLDGVEVEALTYFARNFGAAPRVGVRFDREDWYFFHPADCYTTDGGNYRVKKERALAEGTDFPELVGEHARRRLDGFDGDEDVSGDAHADDPPADAQEAPPARDERTEPSPVEAAESALDDATMDVLAALERGDIDREDAAAMIVERRS